MNILIDVQNMLHALPCYESLLRHNYENAVHRLMLDLGEYQVLSGDKITLVFDGTSRQDLPLASHGLIALFSGAQKSADALIERLVNQSTSPGEILVITNDHAIQNLVIAQGGHSLAPGHFKQMMTRRADENRGRK